MSGGFDDLGLMPEILQAVDELGWNLPTDIQAEAIPLIIGGGDVMAAAETGSGKTAAFCLPIIQCVHERLNILSGESQNTKRKATTLRDHVQLSATDKDPGLEIDGSGLSCETTLPDVYAGARASYGVKSGRYYFECIVSGEGICRVGWSTIAGHLELGKDIHGFGYGTTGWKSNGKFEKYGEKFETSDSIGCYLDLIRKEVAYSRNGRHLGKAFDIPQAMIGSVFFPAVLLKSSEMVINFGEHPFKNPPSLPGFIALSQAPASQLVPADSTEVFSTAASKQNRSPLALIIEPTRDLAEQVFTALQDFTKYVDNPRLHIALAAGGEIPGSKEAKIEKQLKSGVDILVGTLGKLCGLVKSKALDLSSIRFFILDEADQLVSTDNYRDVMELFGKCPGGGTGQHRLQTCFFSATLHSPEITKLSQSICVNPSWVDLKGIDSVPTTVHHVLLRVSPTRHAHYLQQACIPAETDKMHSVLGKRSLDLSSNNSTAEGQSQAVKEIKQHMLVQLIDAYDMSQCLVFCRTNVDCNALEKYLCAAGGEKWQFSGKKETGKLGKYSCCVLAGMRSMEDRRASLQAFKDGDVRILICTDVAARGIDIEGLPYVINMTLPAADEAENYIHRIGRVGRAERMGLAFSLVSEDGVKEKVWYHKCANRGKHCENRELLEKGGCAIWYDEELCLQAVEKRLQARILELQSDFSLPMELKELNIKYGEDQKQQDSNSGCSSSNAHIEQLSEHVRELARLELFTQNMFLQFQTQQW